MKSRIISAVTTGLLAITFLASASGTTLAGTDDKMQTKQFPHSQGAVTTPVIPGAPDLPEEQAGTGFTYQGSLKDGGNPANGQYDLQFTLYDDLTGGNQVGTPVTVTNQTATDGLFSVQLDFGPSFFQGSSRWLEIAVRPGGGGSFTTLSPRQSLTATPYALSLVPGAVISGMNGSPVVTVNNTGSGNGLYGLHSATGGIEAGVRGETNSTDVEATGVLGRVTSTSPGSNSSAVRGINEGTGGFGIGVWGTQKGTGYGVLGDSDNGAGVFGSAITGTGVYGRSTSGVGGYFTSGSKDAIQGHAASNTFSGVAGFNSGSGPGTYGTSNGGYGVYGQSTSSNGVYGTSGTGTGVRGTGTTGDGVRGTTTSGRGGNFTSNSGYGVYGESNTEAAGVFSSTASYGVFGRTVSGVGGSFNSTTGNGVMASSNGGVAGYFVSEFGNGLFGHSYRADGIVGQSAYTNTNGVRGINNLGYGVWGDGITGVRGVGTTGDGVRGTTTSGSGGNFTSSSGYGVYGQSNSSIGVKGQATSGDGVQGYSSTGTGVAGISGGGSAGLYGQSVNGRGVYGTSTNGDGIYGYTAGNNNAVFGQNGGGGVGVMGESNTGYGVSGSSTSGNGVFGTSSGPGNGVYGFANGSNTAVRGLNSSTGDGVFGTNNSTGNGVRGSSANGVGGNFTSGSNDAVQGHAASATFSGVAGFNSGSGSGIFGTSMSGVGVYGSGDAGVVGKATGAVGATSIRGFDPSSHCPSCWAGYFDYNVDVLGTLYANAKSFKIDSPLDPANKYLLHTSVESPDMLNIYRGHVILDAQGSAWVEMPDWFQALNMDFDYQLTAIGKAQPNLYVAQEIKENKFQISGGVAGAKVSWQVTGVRHDPYAEAHRTPVEVEKSTEEKGLYQHPELYNQPESKSITTLYGNGTNTEQPQPAIPSGK